MEYNMNILMLEWDSFGQEYVIEEFRNADYSIDIFPWPFGREDMRENWKKSCLASLYVEPTKDISALYLFPSSAFKLS